MMRSFLIARSNLRRERGQSVILVVLILVGAMVLNLWLMLSTDYQANFDRWHDRLHAEDVLLFVPGAPADIDPSIEKVLDERSDISEYELASGLTVSMAIPYNDGALTNPVVVLPLEDAEKRVIGKVEITSQADATDGLYFPMIYEASMRLGDTEELDVNGETQEFVISGFLNSIMAGSHNCSIILVLAGQDAYDELAEIGQSGTMVSIRLDDPESSSEVRGEIVEDLHEVLPDAGIQGTDYVRNRQSRYVMQSITASILVAAVCFVLIVAMTVAASNAATHVQQYMAELGILKSLGYTGGSLIGTLLLQYTILSLPASLFGSALACLIFPAVSDLMTTQTGIPYEAHFLPGPFFVSVLVCTGIIALSVWLAARRIRRIEPITALRSGVEVHSFNRNPAPLSRSRLSLQMALGMKDCASSPRRNITICITMAALTLLIVFAMTMIANILVDNEPLLDLMGLERADARFTAPAELETELLKALSADERVDHFYLFTQDQNIAERDGPGLSAVIVDDASDLHNQSIVYAGRLPRFENEAALGAKHAAERGLEVGDTLELGTSDSPVAYLITGLTQGTNYLGDEVYFTREGYERLTDLDAVTYYADLAENAPGSVTKESVDVFLDEIQEDLDARISSENGLRTLDAALSVYMAAMEMIVYVLAILTVILTILVMVLLARTALNGRLHEFGILKAVGYTSRNLVAQTLLSFLLPLAISETIGLIVWSLTGNSIVAVFMRGMGTMRCDFVIPVLPIAAAGMLLLIFALGVIALMALSIRKVNPVALMADD